MNPAPSMKSPKKMSSPPDIFSTVGELGLMFMLVSPARAPVSVKTRPMPSTKLRACRNRGQRLRVFLSSISEPARLAR